MSLSTDQTRELAQLFGGIAEQIDATIDFTVDLQEDLSLDFPSDRISAKPLYTDMRILIVTGARDAHPWERNTLADFRIGFNNDTYGFLLEFAATILKYPPLGIPLDTNRGETWRNIAWSNFKNGTSL